MQKRKQDLKILQLDVGLDFLDGFESGHLWSVEEVSELERHQNHLLYAGVGGPRRDCLLHCNFRSSSTGWSGFLLCCALSRPAMNALSKIATKTLFCFLIPKNPRESE